MTPQVQTQDYFRELVTMLFIRKGIIVVVTTLVAIGALLVAFLWPPIYEAKGEILVKQNRPQVIPSSAENELNPLKEEDINSEISLITSRKVAEMTMEVLHLEGARSFGGAISRLDKLQLLNRIAGELNVNRKPNSNVIRVSLTWDDAEEAERILKTYFDQYFRYRSRVYNPPEITDFYERQYQQYREELAAQEEQLIKHSQDHNVPNASAQINSNLMIQQKMTEQLGVLLEREERLNERIRFLERAHASNDLEFFASMDVLQLGRIASVVLDLIIKRHGALAIYTEASEPVQMIDRQLVDARQQLDRELSSYIASQKAESAAFASSIRQIYEDLAALEARSVELHTSLVHVNRIKRDIGALEGSVDNFAKMRESNRINIYAMTDTLFSVSPVDPPHAGPSPIFPDRKKIILVGIVLGFVLACMIGFIVEFFDHTFKRPEDVTNYTGMDPVFSIRSQ